MTSWTTTAPSAYTDVAQAPIWCSFKGVLCGTDSAGLDYRRVKTIILSFYRLEGYLTPLSSLTEMRTFYISDNLIFGDILRSYFNMQSLSYLYLNNNQLTGLIPPITSVNSRLAELRLSDNGLEGRIPEGFGMMRALTLLDLGQNALEGTIPSILNRLSNLGSLYLDSNLLTVTIPVLNQNSLQHVILIINYLTMGSLKEVPVTTFSPSARTYLHTNCLVFRHPRKPFQNVDATHCRSKSPYNCFH